MRLRDYIENIDQKVDVENISKPYLLSMKIIDLLRAKEIEEAGDLVDKYIERLYKALDIDSFCCLVEFYTNNVDLDAKCLRALHKESIPKLLINLSKDKEEKDKRYFIQKLNEYNNSQNWEDVLTVIDILLEKTDIDKLHMYKAKLNRLYSLKRYEEVLNECEVLLSGQYKSDESINKIKLDTLITCKKFDELEQYLEIAEYILDPKTISKAYIALAKNYELKKESDKAYSLYSKASQLDPTYKMPRLTNYKVNGLETSKLKEVIAKNTKVISIAMAVIVVIGIGIFVANSKKSKEVHTVASTSLKYNLEADYIYPELSSFRFGDYNALIFKTDVVTKDIRGIRLEIDQDNLNYDLNSSKEINAFLDFIKTKTGKDYSKKIKSETEKSFNTMNIDKVFVDDSKMEARMMKYSIDDGKYLILDINFK